MSTTESTRKHPTRIFYGWIIVAGGFLIQLLNGGLLFHAFSAYILPLQAQFGWSRAALSGAFSMARAESGILGPFQGWLIDRFGARSTMLVGNLLFGVGFLLFSRMDTLLSFYLSFALIALGSSLGGFMPITATVTNWFARRRATAMAASMVGMGVGGLLVPVVAYSLTAHGWRATAFVSGLLVLAIGMPASLLMRHKPEPYGYLPDGDPPDGPEKAATRRQNKTAADPGFTARQALRTPTFWLLSLGHGSALLVVGAVLVHQVPHMVQSIGLSAEAAAANVALLVAISITGQMTGGYLGDRLDKRLVMFGCMWLHAIALTIFAFATTRAEAALFALLHGTGWGMRGLLINAIRADYFGRAAFASITGFNSLIVMIGMTGGPLFAGFLYDLVGDYQTAFLILAGLAALGSIALFLARKPAPPVGRPSSRD
jgi:sugar phosphate permease